MRKRDPVICETALEPSWPVASFTQMRGGAEIGPNRQSIEGAECCGAFHQTGFCCGPITFAMPSGR